MICLQETTFFKYKTVSFFNIQVPYVLTYTVGPWARCVWTARVDYTQIFFPTNTIQYCNYFFLPHGFLNISFPPAYLNVRIQYIISITYKICANPLFMSSVRLLVSSILLVNFWRLQKLHKNFWLCRAIGPLTITLFKEQLYVKNYQFHFTF